MSSTSSRVTLFSVESYASSNSSYFSIEEYNVKSQVKRLVNQSNENTNSSSNSLFSIDPYRVAPKIGLPIASDEYNENSIDEVSQSKYFSFKRVSRQVSVRRFNFLCSDRQIICNSSKSCCVNLCLTKFERINLRRMREKYLSLDGDEQDTFLISHMQLVRDQATGVHVEYFVDLSLKCRRAAFKIAHSIGDMRLQRVQQRLLKGSWVPIDRNGTGNKGQIGQHAIRWIEVYFSK